MKDKEWKAKKKKVLAIFNTWSERMGFGWYKITIEWKAGDAPEAKDNNEEYCVESLANSFVWVRDAALKDGKKK